MRAGVDQTTAQLDRLVRSDSPGDTEDDATTAYRIHDPGLVAEGEGEPLLGLDRLVAVSLERAENLVGLSLEFVEREALDLHDLLRGDLFEGD